MNIPFSFEDINSIAGALPAGGGQYIVSTDDQLNYVADSETGYPSFFTIADEDHLVT